MIVGKPANEPVTAAAPPHSRGDNPAKIADAARDFEALLVAQLLKCAQAGDDALGGDQAGSTVFEMAQEQMAKAICAGGGLGVAKLIVSGLSSANHAAGTSTQRPGQPVNAR